MTTPTREEVAHLMKRCQIGYGGPNALEHANDILAECYGTLGALDREVNRLKGVLAKYFADNDYGTTDKPKRGG